MFVRRRVADGVLPLKFPHPRPVGGVQGLRVYGVLKVQGLGLYNGLGFRGCTRFRVLGLCTV